MKKFVFRLWQWTWGFPQTLIGAVLYMIHRKCSHGSFHGCVVTYWNCRGSLGMGTFLFIDKVHDQNNPQVMVHEFGHAVQSAILGPLFLPIMGIPSFLWCNLPVCRRFRREKKFSYYRFYPESTANRLGALACREECNLK
jgi:hypothetical protein